ncbi:thiaminase II [Micractinium conductrix]|uniref:Thiaminase II n=1 Tax=Micractinium conductrix TaxID=554055 RepID=A0A2P6V2W1_9CHLO|nr:thiaminase II [Micractinium conductrix]|eukprot:PSC68404.1 thiaminase II [Micractinium conductrix]
MPQQDDASVTDAQALPVEPAAAAAPAAAKSAKSPLPPSVVEAAVPGSFCAQVWRSVDGIHSAILAHPFLTGLADGSLDEAAFKFYVVQDSLYLREYGRALAQVASRAPRSDWTAFFSRSSLETCTVESGFHQEFLEHFGTSVAAETAATRASPNCRLYTSFLLATVHERAFYEGLAAVLPCFVVYLEVGKALQQRGSPHPLYQSWITKYGGPEFEGIVLQVVEMVNEVAAELGEAQAQRLVAAPEGSLMRQVLDASLQLAADHTPSRHRGPHGIAQMPWAAQLQSALAEAGIAADLQQRQPLQPEAVQEAALQHYLQHLQTAVQRRGASRLQHYFDCVRPECLEVAGYGMAPYLVELQG